MAGTHRSFQTTFQNKQRKSSGHRPLSPQRAQKAEQKETAWRRRAASLDTDVYLPSIQLSVCLSSIFLQLSGCEEQHPASLVVSSPFLTRTEKISPSRERSARVRGRIHRCRTEQWTSASFLSNESTAVSRHVAQEARNGYEYHHEGRQSALSLSWTHRSSSCSPVFMTNRTQTRVLYTCLRHLVSFGPTLAYKAQQIPEVVQEKAVLTSLAKGTYPWQSCAPSLGRDALVRITDTGRKSCPC